MRENVITQTTALQVRFNFDFFQKLLTTTNPKHIRKTTINFIARLSPQNTFLLTSPPKSAGTNISCYFADDIKIVTITVILFLFTPKATENVAIVRWFGFELYGDMR